jgi:predicted XRE-type DNA-binding protein
MERFWQKVDKQPNGGCWLWCAGRSHGYGVFNVGGGRIVYAHRVAWEQSHGSIRNGLQVLHRCDVPLCVNPDHLFLGSDRENRNDSAAKGRMRAAARLRATSKLTEASAEAIRQDKRSQVIIAAEYGIDQSLVSQIKAKKCWWPPLIDDPFAIAPRPEPTPKTRTLSSHDPVVRFWSKVLVTDDQHCWEWLGCKSNGYGVMCCDGGKMPAHRYSWRLHHGSIPDALQVLHRCDNPGCVNPAHLSLGTAKCNRQDSSRKGNMRRARLTKKSTKLTPEIVRQIRSDPRPQRVIAASYGICQGHVSLVKLRRVWGDID